MEINIRKEMSSAVREAYRAGIDDEMLEPIVAVDKSGVSVGRITAGDSVIFYNIRGEREVELSRSLTEDDFKEFSAVEGLKLNFATMIEYQGVQNAEVAFPPQGPIKDTLSEVIACQGKRQLKVTESEKAIHMSYFLNGKRSLPFVGEDRIIIPTREDVVLFDEAPEMSIDGISKAVGSAVEERSHQLIIVNFPNVDVVGHIENKEAVLKAVEAVDREAGAVISKALSADYAVAVTADHGTVEKWLYSDGLVDTGHTDSPVPFIILKDDEDIALREKGSLVDVAPTILDLMGIRKPKAMSGRSLITKPCESVAERVVLIILDGWGLADNIEGNLIAQAKTPVMDMLLESHSFATLKSSGSAVGLPEGTVGNSEAGHLHIGAGRVISSDRMRIDSAISDGSFFENDVFLKAMVSARDAERAVHLLGIVSFFSSHGSVDHLFALMKLAKKVGVKELYIHAMLGRRGEKPESGTIYIEKIEDKCRELGLGKIVSVIGRYWSMDREENWDRIEKTYRMLLFGEGNRVEI